MSDKVMVDKAELERLQAAARDAVTRWHIDRKWAMARGQDEYPEAEWVTELREAAALAPASSERAAGAAFPAGLEPMLTAVTEAGLAEWQCTEAMTAEQHGQEFARMVRETAERYGLGDEPRALHWLGVAGDRSLAFVGTSPHSPHLARALTGAWNRLVEEAPDLLAALAPASAVGAVLNWLADYLEIKAEVESEPMIFSNWDAYRTRVLPIGERLHALSPAHLRALAAQAEAGDGEAEKMRHALRNLQLLANQQLFRASRGRDTSEAWHTVKRFCEEGGMVSSPLRADLAAAEEVG
ncbi:hypothetical protein [uncultured Deinococcus sp.]|uniref:hypothetical protein n=1 Tax=uncultured Deinococcus sp. TaxID=158789 RepID=UPI003748F1CD